MPEQDSYLRSLVAEVTAQVAAGFISADTAADRIMRIFREHAAAR